MNFSSCISVAQFRSQDLAKALSYPSLRKRHSRHLQQLTAAAFGFMRPIEQ